MLLTTFRGWPWVKAKWMVSTPLPATFTYGRWPGMVIRVRAGAQVTSSLEVENVGLKLPPRQNSQIRLPSADSWTGFG
jgi:hypothetical protein